MGKQEFQIKVFGDSISVCEQFVQSFLELNVVGASRDMFADFLGMKETNTPRMKEIQKVVSQKKPASAKNAQMPVYELNAKGEVTTAIGRLRNVGFDLGSIVTLDPPVQEKPASELWSIEKAEEHVWLRSLDEPETFEEVSLRRFLRDAKTATTGSRVVRSAGWPGARTFASAEFKRRAAEATVLSALEILVNCVGPGVEFLVDMLDKPRRVVKTKKCLGVGELVLVPETSVVKLQDTDAKPSAHYVEAFCDETAGWEEHRAMLFNNNSATAICPFWNVEATQHEADVNMVTVLFKVQLCGGPDAVSDTAADMTSARELRRIAASSKAMARPKGDSSESTPRSQALRAIVSRELTAERTMEKNVWIPVLVNSKPLQAGVVLKCALAAAEEKSAKEQKPIDVSTLTKKARLVW